jgi:3-phenylpropionate/cinnamic acid dioxygenase small subunit
VTAPVASDHRGEIENLLARYAEHLDDGAFDALGALFANGTVTIEGGPADGRIATGGAEAAALYRDILLIDPVSGRPETRHLITNIQVNVATETIATARCYFCVMQQTPALALQPIATGVYRDTLERLGDQWVFRTRHILCDQVGDLSAHMR